MSKLTERILFLKFVRILKFVKICEFQMEFFKLIKFEFSVYAGDHPTYSTHLAPSVLRHRTPDQQTLTVLKTD